MDRSEAPRIISQDANVRRRSCHGKFSIPPQVEKAPAPKARVRGQDDLLFEIWRRLAYARQGVSSRAALINRSYSEVARNKA